MDYFSGAKASLFHNICLLTAMLPSPALCHPKLWTREQFANRKEVLIATKYELNLVCVCVWGGGQTANKTLVSTK